jgi:hypothetical protein
VCNDSESIEGHLNGVIDMGKVTGTCEPCERTFMTLETQTLHDEERLRLVGGMHGSRPEGATPGGPHRWIQIYRS